MSKTIVDSSGRFGMNHAQEEMRRRLEMENMPRWVMEKGPVLMEDKDGKPRDLPQMFQEFLTKSVFVLSAEPGEPKFVGMVAQEIKSRNATRKEPEGKWQSINGLFVDSALLLANVQACERGSISTEELLRQYPGYDMATLRQMMGQLLGRVYYGEVQEKAEIAKRAEQLVYPEMVAVRADKERGLAPITDFNDLPKNIFIMPYATYQDRVNAHERKERGKRIKIACTAGLLSLACGTLEAIATPTVRPSDAIPPTKVAPGTAVATIEKPAAGETQSVAPSPTPEVQIGYGGPISEQALLDIQEGDYKSQIDGVTEWIAVWASQGLVSPDSTVTIGFLEDQNGQLMAGIDGGDYWLFPPVVNGVPAYQGAPAPGTPLAENYDPFRVNKVITEQQALDQGYSAEMAKFLDGSAAELRSGMLVRVRSGQVIAYVGLQSRRWEKLPELPFVSSDAQAQSCRIREDQVDAWFILAKLSDNTGRFGAGVLHWPLGESHILGGPASPAHVYWMPTEQDSNPWNKFVDPSISPFKRVVYCSVDRNSWYETVRLVKYLNPSGKISWLLITGPGGGDGRKGDFPIMPDDNPSIAQPLRDWAASGGQADFPAQLEGKLLREVY